MVEGLVVDAGEQGGLGQSFIDLGLFFFALIIGDLKDLFYRLVEGISL